jgi:hypothetical protein
VPKDVRQIAATPSDYGEITAMRITLDYLRHLKGGL